MSFITLKDIFGTKKSKDQHNMNNVDALYLVGKANACMEHMISKNFRDDNVWDGKKKRWQIDQNNLDIFKAIDENYGNISSAAAQIDIPQGKLYEPVQESLKPHISKLKDVIEEYLGTLDPKERSLIAAKERKNNKYAESRFVNSGKANETYIS
jgi:hypothetical protein